MGNFKVAVEFRPRIRSCHFFIRINEKPLSVEVNEPNVVLIKKEKGDLKVSLEDVHLATDSVSGLLIDEFSLYFQARSVPENMSGSFYREIIIPKKKLDSGVISELYKPELEPNSDVEILCKSCLNCIVKSSVTFKRILPLPSSDGCDFFCHKHTDTPIDLNPKPEDCFYGHFFFKINSDHFYTSNNSDVLCCEACASWLGVQEKSCVTLWNSSVTFKNINDDVKKAALQDFISLFKFLVQKDLGVTCKIIFYNKLNNGHCNYLLLWVMDKDLSLLVDDHINENEVILKKIKVAKVMYKFEETYSALVQQWKKDLRVNEEQISKPMMFEGLHYLEEMSSIIPDNFKKTNEMYVSYV